MVLSGRHLRTRICVSKDEGSWVGESKQHSGAIHACRAGCQHYETHHYPERASHRGHEPGSFESPKADRRGSRGCGGLYCIEIVARNAVFMSLGCCRANTPETSAARGGANQSGSAFEDFWRVPVGGRGKNGGGRPWGEARGRNPLGSIKRAGLLAF